MYSKKMGHPMLPDVVPNSTASLASYNALPSSSDLSRQDGYKLCPIRQGDTPHCWGFRCAAFRQVDAMWGMCALIEQRGTP